MAPYRIAINYKRNSKNTTQIVQDNSSKTHKIHSQAHDMFKAFLSIENSSFHFYLWQMWRSFFFCGTHYQRMTGQDDKSIKCHIMMIFYKWKNWKERTNKNWQNLFKKRTIKRSIIIFLSIIYLNDSWTEDRRKGTRTCIFYY